MLEDYVPPSGWAEIFGDSRLLTTGEGSPLLRRNKHEWVLMATRLVRFWAYDEAHQSMPEFAPSEPGYRQWKFLCSIAEQANELDDT